MHIALEQNLALHYKKEGNGSKILVAFHGYGNDCSLFDILIPYLKDDYTILSFDLPFHGQSIWPKTVAFTQQHLNILTEQILELCQVKKISLLGYSLGGRICMNILV